VIQIILVSVVSNYCLKGSLSVAVGWSGAETYGQWVPKGKSLTRLPLAWIGNENMM
jgi:hypothetical protein